MQGGFHPAHSRHLCDPEPLVWGVVEEPPTGSGRTGAFVSVSAQDEERSERSQEAQCPPVGGQAQQKAAILVLLGKWSQDCLGPLSSSVTGILEGSRSCNHRVRSYPDPRGKGLFVVLTRL